MIYTSGSPSVSENAKILAQWHRRYAWCPVRISANKKVWLDWVERRLVWDKSVSIPWYEHWYRIQGDTGEGYLLKPNNYGQTYQPRKYIRP